jgi:arylsulfatase A-like enzyme
VTLRTRILALLLAASVVPLLVICSADPSGTARRPNFVIILVDTLRADAFHFATGREPTPNADALQHESTWFTNAFTTSSWTVPALASLFVSQIGSQHRVVQWGSALADEQNSFVEELRRAGYRTGGWSANVLLSDHDGFDQGFEEFEVLVDLEGWGKINPELFPSASADSINEHALAWLRKLRARDPDSPFFAYLHYMEPHTPYRCPTAEKACQEGAKGLTRRLMNGDWNFSEQERGTIRTLYGAEVGATDEALGSLLAALEEGGFRDDTWVVLTSDHGEMLGEYGRYLHGESLYPKEIRIPLLVSGPARAASVVHTAVSLVDIAPTLFDLAGIEAPPTFRGRSLRAALEGGEIVSRPIVAELFPRSGSVPLHRLVVLSGPGGPADSRAPIRPGGGVRLVMAGDGQFSRVQRDGADAFTHPTMRWRLMQELGEMASWVDFSASEPAEAPEISDEMRERLRALGYQP